MTKQRTYERTHPWIKFELNLKNARYSLWVSLGEAQSKCEQIAGTPLSQEAAKELHLISLVKGVRATTAIEGNTLSEADIRLRMEKKLTLQPSREYLGQEVDNVIAAINKVLGGAILSDSTNLSIAELKEYNRMILQNLKAEEGVVPGEIRSHEVGVMNYSGAPAQDCHYLLEKLCEWLNREEFSPPGENRVIMGILRAIVAHLYLAWIHPFGDGNGRTARLVEFQILVSSGVPSPAAHLLSNHYNQTRSEYYRQLDYASRSGGDILPFIEYAVRGLTDGLRESLGVIRNLQLDLAWRDFVHETFRERTSAVDVRRRHLLLDMSKRSDPISLLKLPEISPRVAAEYSGKTHKTLQRDVAALMKIGMVEQVPGGFRAKKEQILAFLPPRRTGETTEDAPG